MGQNSHTAEPPTQYQNNATPNDPEDGHRVTDRPGPIGKTPAEKTPPNDQQDQATIEDFDREGMGVAGKE